MYSETVMEHFKNPRNVGTIEDADGVGEVGNPICGDMMTFYIKVKDNRIEDIKFQTFGCGAAVATSSMLTELVKGKTIAEAEKIAVTSEEREAELNRNLNEADTEDQKERVRKFFQEQKSQVDTLLLERKTVEFLKSSAAIQNA